MPRGGRLSVLQAGPLPPPWSGIGVSLQQLIASRPLQAQDTYVLDTSSRGLPGDPRREKRPTARRLSRHAGLALQTVRLIRRHRIHVVHLHGSSHDLSLFGNALSVVAARACGARTLWHLHEDLGVVAYPGQRRSTQRAFSGLMRLPDALAVLSDNSRRIAARFVDPRKIAVLPPTCNADLVDVPLERDASRQSVSILFVGWLTADKGIYDLIEVADQMRDVPVTFFLMGSGMTVEETAAVQRTIEGRGLQEMVTLCGVLTGDAKRRMFAEADILFLPTHWDAFPVVVLEAMAAGLPIVSTLVGGVPDLVQDGQGGLLAPVGDTSRLAEHLSHLARGAPRERLRMGTFNRQRFNSRWHPDVVGQAAVDVYYQLLGGRD